MVPPDATKPHILGGNVFQLWKSSSIVRTSTAMVATLTLSLVFVMATANDAAAQTTSDDEAAAAGLLLTTTIGGVTTTAGGIVLTVVLVNNKDDDNKEAMKVYIENNSVALQQDITMGGGDTIDDLAESFGVPASEHAAFGRAMRSRRDVLMDLVDARTVDEERAGEFIEEVYAAMATDERLARQLVKLRLISG